MNIWKIILVCMCISMTSCMKTEILNAPEDRCIIDTIRIKPTKTYIDTTYMNMSDSTDTTDQRVPIGFDPTVEDWDEEDDIDI